jgi:hypothetical protein
MARSFDSALWTRRAYASKRGTLYCRLAAVDGLKRTIAWARRRGFNVEFEPCSGRYGFCFNKSKKIVVDPRLSFETQLHVLLHECGHALIDSGQRFRHEWPRGYDAAENGYSTHDHRHKVAVLVEEIEAWCRGRKLASRLKLMLNDEAFCKIRDKLIKSYIKSAL